MMLIGSRSLTYLITFACYGWHLHGDESGSVDRHHNIFGSPLAEPNSQRAAAEREKMSYSPYLMNEADRDAVLTAIKRHCTHRGWSLVAAHVRSNHVHVVVEGDAKPEKMMNEFKAYASRGLNRVSCDATACRRWARHGSTRWLWRREDVQRAVRYVIEGQGASMALFVREDIRW